MSFQVLWYCVIINILAIDHVSPPGSYLLCDSKLNKNVLSSKPNCCECTRQCLRNGPGQAGKSSAVTTDPARSLWHLLTTIQTDLDWK